MIWLTLRQFRVQGAALFGALAVLGVALALTGPGLADDYSKGLASCGTEDACAHFSRRFFTDHEVYYGAMIAIVMIVPALIGLFWGAPLITRELESGTHRLVWNQSVTRSRWLAVKLGVVGLAAMAAAGLTARAANWWSEPLDKAVADRFARVEPLNFSVHGIVPIGHAAFAFALGVTVGVLTRRTLPAMAITLAVFAGRPGRDAAVDPPPHHPARDRDRGDHREQHVADDAGPGRQGDDAPCRGGAGNVDAVEPHGRRVRAPRRPARLPARERVRPEDPARAGAGSGAPRSRTGRPSSASPRSPGSATSRRSSTTPPGASGRCSGPRPACSPSSPRA
ncbi:ABC transporter permease [Actinomadura madurae]|uniref:ABC transporter permease n=1 Tax=Actinomadura madurae TaxID=1993 RepID=UPI0020D245CA|nr:ABC transporter permease [Actinomadura madurae]MCP9970057.1 ABC transporter permease [Actinomadura madurae]